MTTETPILKNTTQQGTQPATLRETVYRSVESYLDKMKDQEITTLYSMVLSEIEHPLLEVVMKHTRGNQTHAAKMMGLNRGTLRKKLKLYGMCK